MTCSNRGGGCGYNGRERRRVTLQMRWERCLPINGGGLITMMRDSVMVSMGVGGVIITKGCGKNGETV